MARWTARQKDRSQGTAGRYIRSRCTAILNLQVGRWVTRWTARQTGTKALQVNTQQVYSYT